MEASPPPSSADAPLTTNDQVDVGNGLGHAPGGPRGLGSLLPLHLHPIGEGTALERPHFAWQREALGRRALRHPTRPDLQLMGLPRAIKGPGTALSELQATRLPWR